MTQRVACQPVPGPLEECAGQFDDLFSTLAQRRGFRTYLRGLLLPRDQEMTLGCLKCERSPVAVQDGFSHHPAPGLSKFAV